MNSNLQIISGMYKGRKLRRPTDARPTQNKARIAIFNMLDNGILPRDATPVVWDAFAGSGAFGLEILSRYAGARVVFTDAATESINVIRANVASLNVGGRATVHQTDAFAPATIGAYGAAADIIFLDPPYAMADAGRGFVETLGDVARGGTFLIWEQDSRVAVTPNADVWEILRDKEYGRARFLILRRK